MKKTMPIILITVAAWVVSGCESMKIQPYAPVPEGVTISGSQDTGYRVDSINLKRSGITSSPESLQFCFAQNIPGIIGQPILNPSKTRITAQGRDQVSFIVPKTMGTPLNYDILFSITSSNDAHLTIFEFTNLRIKGTWSSNETPLPGSQSGHLYLESAVDKLDVIADNVISCLKSEI